MSKLVPLSFLLFLLCLVPGICYSQAGSPPTDAPQQTESGKGNVLFEKHSEAAFPKAEGAQKEAPANAVPDITDTERGALVFSAYDLDARLTPANAHLAMRARVTVRNDGSVALKHLALQISSSLAWESVTAVNGSTRTRLALSQHLLDTDADRTGKASEAILTLPVALAPGASLMLDTFYSGNIAPSAARLERIGASANQAAQSDWDAVGEDSTSLRGFGNVLWYPVAAPQLFLGQGAQLFEAVGQAKLHQASATAGLHLTVEFNGAPPVAAYFCGRRQALKEVGGDTPDGVPGLVTADFPAAALGFRTLSLFVIPERETFADPQPGGRSLLAVAAERSVEDANLPVVAATANDAGVILAEWMGPQPLSALTVIDHQGQPFEDGPLLVASLRALAAPAAEAAITHTLTHAWVQTGSPWIDEGLAEFFVLLSTERTRGREAAVAQLGDLLQTLVLADIAPEAGKPAPAGQPLPGASDDLYYRRKAVAVWWMLRGIVGDDALKLALQSFRLRAVTQDTAHNTPQDEALVFEGMLEKTHGKDLHWFFDDWVLHDRGLPDLTLVDVTPRELPAGAKGSTGWLVSVTARNDGAAVADVPVVIRSGSFSTTQRLRIAGFSSASTRVIVEALPTEVVLNDGSTPEQRVSLHTRAINVHTH